MNRLIRNTELFFQEMAARAASVEIIKVGTDWRCEVLNSRGYYIGGTSAGPGDASFKQCQRDAYEIARFITQPIAKEV